MSWCDFVAGWVGGSTGLVFGHPLDTVKVIQQASAKPASILGVSREILVTEGARGFFKGMLYPVITAGAINSVFFGVYGVCMDKMKEHSPQLMSQYHLSSVYLAGMVGGTVQLAIACPVELVKIRLQTSVQVYRGPWHCLSHTMRRHGLRGLATGLGPHWVRDGHGFGVYVVLYEALLALTGGRDQAGKMEQFWAGGLAGVLCWLSVLPSDVVKSRMQADSLDITKRSYTGALDCIRQSLAKEGLGVFFRGAVAMSARALPVNGVTFLVYESLLEHCNKMNQI